MKTKKMLITLVMFSISITAVAQLNPMGSMYYQNLYLSNPAMAGIEKGWEAAAAYKAQWTAIQGAPAMQLVTAAYGSSNNKVGVGASFYNENIGVIQRTSFKGTYAFHLPLNSGSDYLDFGLSAGVMNEWIDFTKINGNQNDIALTNFNQRKLYLDGDFGMAYRSQHLNVQGSVLNLKRFLKRDDERTVVDRASYFAAVSYKFINPDRVLSLIEPKVSYRGIDNYRDIVDIGLNAQLWTNKLLFTGLYHTSNSFSFGVGTTYQNRLSILAMYTTNTSAIQNYANGEFELGLKYNFR